ncbi:MAG: hypothetical protein HY608_01705 [Planctomycetes bacterium]|nr:hypothetical protein [Planctomycetota bacterium]
MTYRGLLEHLRSHGVDVTRRMLAYAIERGRLADPAKSTSGQRIWSEAELEQVLRHFRTPRPPARHGRRFGQVIYEGEVRLGRRPGQEGT